MCYDQSGNETEKNMGERREIIRTVIAIIQMRDDISRINVIPVGVVENALSEYILMVESPGFFIDQDCKRGILKFFVSIT